uniref:Uncharacterized protein n=1 Tax=Cannabis sativa TaxID=3483 RepID=A0A803PB52_CANSA
MDEILGVEPIAFSESEDEGVTMNVPDLASSDLFQAPLSPKSSLKAIQQQEEIRTEFAFFMQANQQCSAEISKDNSPQPPVLRSESMRKNLASSFVSKEQGKKVKIQLEDIEDEISYWSPSIVCYVLGANPPLSILDGFARRI